MMQTRISKAILALVLSCAVLGCTESKSTPAASPMPAADSAPVPALKAEPTVFSGPIVVENQVDVTAQREGVVMKIQADVGMHVKAGQVLATLDDRQIAADLEAARARSRSTEADLKNWQSEAEVLNADYQRAQKMWEAQLITKEQLDHARYKADSDQWDVKRVQELLVSYRSTEQSLQLELEKTQVRAPFEGMVARRYVRAGERVTAGSRLFWVTAEEPMRVRFTVPEKLSGSVKIGQTFEVESPNAPDEKHSARVMEISPVVDPASGTFEVLAELTGARGTFRPGMTVNLRPGPQK